MKLLGWMHRKFRQNSNEPFKEFPIGNSCNCLLGQPSLEEQQFYPKPTYGSRPHTHNHKQPQKDQNLLRKSFAGLEAVRIEEEDFEGQSDAISELFDGLLAIGTLGSDPVVDEPATPTFAVSLEHVTEKEAEVTENDLKLINEELEKVLGADAKDEKCNDSSGRTSHVSSITLSGRDSNAVCPLQGYLFGSPIELPETTTTSVVKKEHRTSLGELFQRTKMAEEKGDQKEEKREGEKPVKKTLKRRMLRSSTNVAAAAAAAASASATSATATGTTTNAATATDSVSAETKLNKILQIFHRKVHPESSTTVKKGNGGNNNISQQKAHRSEGKVNDGERAIPIQVPVPDEDIVIFPKGPICKQRIRRYKCYSNSASFALGGSDSNGNREHWIKTDADYLVLEL